MLILQGSVLDIHCKTAIGFGERRKLQLNLVVFQLVLAVNIVNTGNIILQFLRIL